MKLTAILVLASALGVQCASTTSSSTHTAPANATTPAATHTSATTTTGGASTKTSTAGVPPNAAIPGVGLAAILAIGAYVV